MPPVRTDADQTGGYPVAPVAYDADPDGDFRLLDIRDIYPRLMQEDDEALNQAAAGWQALGQKFFGGASALRSGSTALAEAWQSDAATVLVDRVTAAATSFDAWGYVAVGRAYEVSDLATALRTGKSRLQQLWDQFHHATGELLTPPPDLTAEQRQEWRSQVAGAPAVEVTIRTHTQQVLDEVVNPLANRFSEAALSFTVTGPVYAGPTNAAVPSDAVLLALATGSWLPDGAAAPPVPRVPGAPAMRSAPTAPAVPAPSPVPVVPPLPPLAAGVAPVVVRGAAPTPQPVGLPAFPPTPVAAPGIVAPGVVAPRTVGPGVVGPGMVGLGVVRPGVVGPGTVPLGTGATGLASLLGRQVDAASALPTAPPAPSAPVRLPGAGASGAPSVGAPGAPVPPGLPRLPGGAGGPRGAAPPTAPHLPGRTGAPGTPANPPPPGPRRPTGTSPQLGGRTTRTSSTAPPSGTAPEGPQLPGRGATDRLASTPAPPVSGARRGPGPQQGPGHGARAQQPTSGKPGGGHLSRDASVPASLRSGRSAPSPHEEGRPTVPAPGRHAAPAPATDLPRTRAVGRHRPDGRSLPTHPELGRRPLPVAPLPAPAEQRAADRARRRAEWDAARGEHRPPLSP